MSAQTSLTLPSTARDETRPVGVIPTVMRPREYLSPAPIGSAAVVITSQGPPPEITAEPSGCPTIFPGPDKVIGSDVTGFPAASSRWSTANVSPVPITTPFEKILICVDEDSTSSCTGKPHAPSGRSVVTLGPGNFTGLSALAELTATRRNRVASPQTSKQRRMTPPKVD